MATTEDFEIDWNNDRSLVTGRVQFGDMEIAAHHHMATPDRAGTDSLGFTRNSGADGTPYIDFGTHLPEGGYRRLAAMLTALADAADAEKKACANCEGAGCNDCLPEPHDAETEDASNF